MKCVLFLLVVLVAAARGLRNGQENKFDDYGKVTLVEYDDEGYYTLNADGIPDHDCATNKCGTSQTSKTYKAPNSPVTNTDGTCMPFGVIGMALNGVAFFNPYSIEPAPALDCENTDNCIGHPNGVGVYHYHGDPKCLNAGSNGLLGIAFDGHPIYRRYVSGSLPTTSELNTQLGVSLDECHGATVNNQYRYYVTSDFPYVLGCFRGTPSDSVNTGGPNCYTADTSKITIDGCNAVTFDSNKKRGLAESEVSRIRHVRGHVHSAHIQHVRGTQNALNKRVSGSAHIEHVHGSQSVNKQTGSDEAADKGTDRRRRVLKMLMDLMKEK